MQLSVFFRSYYTWLDRRAHELTQQLSAELLERFIHQATLLLACEHDVLRPGVLSCLVGDVREVLRARLCDDPRRDDAERKIARLARSSSVAVFQFEMRLVRDALSLAGLRAESWALFAEAALSPEDVVQLEARIARCHDSVGILVASPEAALRVEVLH
jgi:hypothetical protein